MLLAGLAVLAILALGIFTIPVAFAENQRISPVFGAGVAGCQDRNGCFNPMTTTIEAGDTITFWNSDYVSHTFTSGTPDDGPDGIFDSGLALAGSLFRYEIDTVGEIPYFCLVHPWMTGLIIVEGDQPEPEPEIPKSDQADLHTLIDQLVELIDDLKEQMALLEDKITALEDRITALEAGDSEPEPDPAFVEVYVYFDSNGNGRFDDNESGLADMTVVLVDFHTNTILDIFQTDNDGYYSLWLEGGDYTFSVAATDLSYAIYFAGGQNVRVDLGLDTMPETEPEPETPETPESTGSDVFITTDKTAYTLGDTIKVTGFIDRTILDAQYIDDRFGTPETRYNVPRLNVNIETYQQFYSYLCERPQQTVGESDLDPDTFYIKFSSHDPSRSDRKCFDESGNFDFNFPINSSYPAGQYIAKLKIQQYEGTGITEQSSSFTVG